MTSVPVWIKEKLFMKKMLKDELNKFGKAKIPILFPEHHLSHGAGVHFTHPHLKKAAILTVDGVGE